MIYSNIHPFFSNDVNNDEYTECSRNTNFYIIYRLYFIYIFFFYLKIRRKISMISRSISTNLFLCSLYRHTWGRRVRRFKSLESRLSRWWRCPWYWEASSLQRPGSRLVHPAPLNRLPRCKPSLDCSNSNSNRLPFLISKLNSWNTCNRKLSSR